MAKVPKSKPKPITDDGLDHMRELMAKSVRPGAGCRLGDQEREPLSFVSTGSLGADFAFGGGFPRARISEIYGPEASGKSTLCLSAAGGVLRAGGRVAWVDMEYAFNYEWAETLGVDADALYFEQSEYGEQALRFVEIAIKEKAFDLIVIDSLAALIPKAVLEGEIGDATIGAQARMMSQALSKLNPAIGRSSTAVVFINQMREKVGVMFGSPETTPGGKAVKYYSSLRVDVRKGQPFPTKEAADGNFIKLSTKKARHDRPGRKAEVPLLYASGLDAVGELFDLAKDCGLLGTGSHSVYAGTKLGNGRAAGLEWLRANPEVHAAMRAQVLEVLSAQ